MAAPQSTGSVSLWIAALTSLAVGVALGAGMSIVFDQPPTDIAALRQELTATKAELEEKRELVDKSMEVLAKDLKLSRERKEKPPSLPRTNSSKKPLGAFRTSIVDQLRRTYTLTILTEREDYLMVNLGEDVVVEILGTEEKVHQVNILGSLSEVNQTDLGRAIGIVWNSFYVGDDWFQEWLEGAVLKVDVGYTITGSRLGYKVQLSGYILQDEPLLVIKFTID